MLSGDISKVQQSPKKRRGLLGESLDDNQIFIGFAKSPIMLCTRAEASDLINNDFWQFFGIWENYHYGGFWPVPPQNMDVDVMSVVLSMEKYFRRHFSQESVIITYLEAMLKRNR